MLRPVLMIIIVMFVFSSSFAHDELRFVDLAVEARSEIARSFISHLEQHSSMLLLVRMRAENVVPSAWTQLPCSKNAFVCMRANCMFPSHQSVDCLAMTDIGLSWYSTVYPSRDPEENGRQLKDLEKGLYRPLLRMPSRPILSFVKRLEVDDSIHYIEPSALRLGLDRSEFCVLSNLCKNATFQFSAIMSFGIKGVAEPEFACTFTESEKRVVEMERKMAQNRSRQSRIIILSKREATEMVYVTALCRGVVGSMKEFNGKYVGKGPEFIVELTDPKCETEFGRLLYNAAKDKGLLPKRDGVTGKNASNGKGKDKGARR